MMTKRKNELHLCERGKGHITFGVNWSTSRGTTFKGKAETLQLPKRMVLEGEESMLTQQRPPNYTLKQVKKRKRITQNGARESFL